MMEIQKVRRFLLGNVRLLLLLLLSAYSFCVKSQIIVGNNSKNEPFVSDVSYKYHLFNNEQKELDCVGTLQLTIAMPIGVERLIFERTKPHITEAKDVKFLFKSEVFCNDSIPNLIIPNIYWGSYFRICGIVDDGARVSSPIFSVDDFINDSDLFLLKQSSLQNLVNTDKVHIDIRENKLYVDSFALYSLFIFDLSGKLLLRGNFNNPIEISIDDMRSSFLIIKYTSTTQSLIKKIKLK